MRKWIKYIFWFIGFIIWVIGLITVPENLDKWRIHFGIEMDISTIINQNTIRWTLFVIGMFIVFICSNVLKKLSLDKNSNINSKTLYEFLEAYSKIGF